MIRTEKVSFDSNGETIVGTLYLPDAGGKHAAVVTDGPLTSVKALTLPRFSIVRGLPKPGELVGPGGTTLCG